MTDRERIQRALEPLRASDGTLEEVLDMIRDDKVKRMKRAGRHTARTALIAAAMAAALTVSAYAIGEYTGFFEMVFGDEDAGRTTYELPVDSWDEDGNQRTMEITMEGEPVDQEMAQRVLDGKVATSGASLTFGDYTCTVEDVTMADNGIGVMTYTIESEKGFPDLNVTDETWGYFSLADGGWLGAGDGESYVRDVPNVFPEGEGRIGSPDAMDVQCSLVERTDTKLTVAAYMASFGEAFTADALDVYFFFGDKGDFSDEYKVTVQLAEPAETVELTGPDGWTASLSPVGLAISPREGDPYGYNYGFGDLVIHYTDGSEYVVEAGEPYTVNTRVSCITDGGIVRYVFNRLIDPEQVENITAVGYGDGYQDENGEPVPYEESWVEVESKLVGDTWTSSTALREGLTELHDDLDLTFTK